MGNSKTRYDFSPVLAGVPDGNGLANSTMYVYQHTDYYFGLIFQSRTTSIVPTPFQEYPNGGVFYVNSTNGIPQDLNICMTNSYRTCGALVNKVVDSQTGAMIPLTRVVFEPSITPCRTYPYRLGSILPNTDYPFVYETTAEGTKCRISIKDYKESAVAESRCCRASHIQMNLIDINKPLSEIYTQFVNMSYTDRGTCPSHFSNGYTTMHCNNFMDEWCRANGNTSECIMYMLAQLDQRSAHMSPFIEYCSKNLHDTVCSYMAIQARKTNQSEVPDKVLREFCTANPTDPGCKCYNTYDRLPSNFKDNAYIGPLSCWYKPCAEEARPQFLLTEQLEQRRGCDITRCTIDVGNINLSSANPSLVTLLNDCNVSLKNRTTLPSSNMTFFDNPIWNMGNMGLLRISLLSIGLLICFVLN